MSASTENPPHLSGGISPNPSAPPSLISRTEAIDLARSLHAGRERARNIAAAHEAEARPIGPEVRSLGERIERLRPDPVADAQAAERERKAMEMKEEARRTGLLEAARVPARYSAADGADLSGLPADVAESYAARLGKLRRLFRRPGTVALIGSRGAGKTWMACALVRDFCRAGRAGRYAKAMDYFVALQDTYGPDAKGRPTQVEAEYLKPELLILDAMEERADTPWNDRMLIRLIDKRYDAELSTVLVSNETEAEFNNRVGNSIGDRLRDDGGKIECVWPSLRGRLVHNPES